MYRFSVCWPTRRCLCSRVSCRVATSGYGLGSSTINQNSVWLHFVFQRTSLFRPRLALIVVGFDPLRRIVLEDCWSVWLGLLLFLPLFLLHLFPFYWHRCLSIGDYLMVAIASLLFILVYCSWYWLLMSSWLTLLSAIVSMFRRVWMNPNRIPPPIRLNRFQVGVEHGTDDCIFEYDILIDCY